MKLYVDELPKNCAKCQFCDKDNGLCEMLGQYFRDGYDYTDCPLQSLADYTKKVKKEVCDEIYKKCEPLFRLVNNYDNGDVIERNELVDILEKVEKGDK